MTALALWCTRHRLLVVLTWALVLLGLGAGTLAKGSAYNSSFALSGTDSTQAQQLLDSAFPGHEGDTVDLVWHVDGGTVRAASVESSVNHVLGEMTAAHDVQSVQSPYTSGGAGQISADGKTAYAAIDLDDATSGLSSAEANSLIAMAHGAEHSGLQVELGGSAVSNALQTPAEDSEVVGMAAAAGTVSVDIETAGLNDLAFKVKVMIVSTDRHACVLDERSPIHRKAFKDALGVARRLVFHNGDDELCPGIRLLHMPGHTPGMQVAEVLTARGPVLLISDASHFYANMNEGRPFFMYHCIEDVFASYRRIRVLALSPDHIIPGHDPIVMEQYPAPRPDMEGQVVRLDVAPRFSAVSDATTY